LELVIHRETTKWDELIQRFKVNFVFNMKHEYPLLDATLQVIRNKIFSEEGLMDFIMPSLRIAVITDLLDSSTTKGRFSHLVHLEEDLFVIGFDKQVQKAREKSWHDRNIKQKKIQVGDLVLIYDSKFMQHPGKFRMH
jgi:hypothetical protein